MRGKWGRAWLAAVVIIVGLICVPLPGRAGAWERGGSLPFLLTGAQTPMEAQMLGAKPFQAKPVNPGAALIPGAPAALQYDQKGGAILKLRGNLEMHISVLYNRNERDSVPLEYQKGGGDSLLMKYSLDYRLLPNLKVGLNAYLYRPDPVNNPSLTGSINDRVMGMGPGLKYDLGRWSFLMKSQVETGDRKDVQNWFRIWYAF